MRMIDADRMKEELLWGNVFLSAKETNAIVDLLDNQPTLTPPNEPLTLEQLREMDGEPVWFDTIKRWGIVKVNRECIFVVTKSGEYEFGRCKVYRRPPEGAGNA